jgi:hypothetical protein
MLVSWVSASSPGHDIPSRGDCGVQIEKVGHIVHSVLLLAHSRVILDDGMAAKLVPRD